MLSAGNVVERLIVSEAEGDNWSGNRPGRLSSWHCRGRTQRERALARLDDAALQEDSLALILPATYRPLSIESAHTLHTHGLALKNDRE